MIHDSKISEDIINGIGVSSYEILANGTPKSFTIDKVELGLLLSLNRKDWIIRIADCRDNLDLNWGARGVFFGESSRNKWLKLLRNAKKGFIELNQKKFNARFMMCKLIESDRFDVDFWNKAENTISTMEKARIRLSPVFFRSKNSIDMIGCHATFVNTSRKVHIGKHSICVPAVINYR